MLNDSSDTQVKDNLSEEWFFKTDQLLHLWQLDQALVSLFDGMSRIQFVRAAMRLGAPYAARASEGSMEKLLYDGGKKVIDAYDSEGESAAYDQLTQLGYNIQIYAMSNKIKCLRDNAELMRVTSISFRYALERYVDESVGGSGV